jgi:hypothetical protein
LRLLDRLPKAWEGLLADHGPMLCFLGLNLQQCALTGEHLAQLRYTANTL